MSDKVKYTDLLRNKLLQQKEVYENFKNNKCPSVCYKRYEDAEWGVRDENYQNRLRLSYYMLYEKIDDEKVSAALFEEELKDRETNDFQGIGDTITILTQFLKKYNTDGKYTLLFERAKEANFDCCCGYDVDNVIDDNIENNDIRDCIYLAKAMDYMDIMEELVEYWKQTETEWNRHNAYDLIHFNEVLNKQKDNEEIYKQLLLSVDKENVRDTASAYSNIIGYYIKIEDYKTAYKYLTELLGGYNLDEIKNIRLYDYILEYGLEIIANAPEFSNELWNWAKPELQNKKDGMFGNLYKKGIKAAKAVNDPYSQQLEKEYIAWKKKVGI